MMFWVVAALVTAAVCIVVIAPFKRAPRLSTALMVLIPVATMCLYLWWGNPDMPDQPLASRYQMALQHHNQALAAADQLARQLVNDTRSHLPVAGKDGALIGMLERQKALDVLLGDD